MAKTALASEELANKFRTEKDTAYTRWVKSEGLDIIGAHYVRNLRTVDLSLSKMIPWAQLGSRSSVEVRLEAFNVFNRANFGVPALIAFAGAADNEPPFSTFGRITNTVTSSRQIQLGVRVAF